MARPIVPQSVASRDVPDPNGPLPAGWRRTRSGQIKRRNILWRMRRYLVGAVAMSVLLASAAGAQMWSSVELPTAAPAPRSSYLCDATVTVGCDRDKAFTEFAKPNAGEPVRFSQIPDIMVLALVASEDKDFFSHRGVDPAGIGRAVMHELRSDSSARQGGSTLTQQLVKVMTEDDSLTLSRKVKEAIQAMKMEQELGKEEILTRYLNSIYFGRNATGIAAAVRAYFGEDKKVEDIGLPEAAYLAAVIREPEFVDANRQPDDPLFERQRTYATGRRKDVLGAMLNLGFISQADRDRVADMGWDYVIPKPKVRPQIWDHEDIGAYQWREYVKYWLSENLNISEEQLATGGLRVYASMDPILQRQAYDAVNGVLGNEFDATQHPDAALAALDDQGLLRAMVGSRDGRSLGTNLAVCPGDTCKGRQPGSSFKPVALAQYLVGNPTGLDKRFDNDKALQVPTEAPIGNVGDEYTGPVDLIEATTKSFNVVYARLLQEEIKNNRAVMDLAKQLGNMTDDDFVPAATKSPRLALGDTVSATPLEMATIYSVFANHGERIDPYPVWKVTDATGKPVWEAKADRRQRILPVDVADTVSYVLKGVIEDNRGTGHKEGRVQGQTVAGKTGSQALEDPANKAKKENSDAWFAGYTCRLSASVWIGRQQGALPIGQMADVQIVNGSTLPARIFSRFMSAASATRGSCPFERPQSSYPATTIPPTTERPSTTEREPWWRRDRDRDRNGDGDSTTTTNTRQPPFTFFPRPTAPDDQPTTTQRGGRPTTTAPDPDQPGRPVRPGAGVVGGAAAGE